MHALPKLSPYRWVVLASFMLINTAMQVLWICYAPVASTAMTVFGVGRARVDLLANIFMLIYLPVALPASWAIDTLGFRKAVGFGAALTGVFGLLRALLPTSYTVALIGSIGLSVAQPFLMNAFTAFAARWFPAKQRATITGVLFLSLFLGVGLGESLGPTLLRSSGFSGMQLIYGASGAAAAVIFLLLARDGPRTPVGVPGEEARALVLDGLRRIVSNRSVVLLSVVLFLGSGIVNGVFTLIDGLGKELSMTVEQDVVLAAVLLLGGVVGSVLMPAVSDALGKRKPVIIAAVFLAVPATLGMVLARSFGLALACFAALGVVVTGVTPVAYQYGAEITHPAPEGTSNGVLALVVQASGFLILLMDALRASFHDSYAPSFIGLAVLLGAGACLLFFISESPAAQRRNE